MLSFRGRCFSFNATADGYGRGEGCAAAVIERGKQRDSEERTLQGWSRMEGVALGFPDLTSVEFFMPTLWSTHSFVVFTDKLSRKESTAELQARYIQRLSRY